MERILTVVELGIQVGGESLISTIKIAILPIAKVFTVCSLGLLMASLAHGRKLLNGVRQNYTFVLCLKLHSGIMVCQRLLTYFFLATCFLAFASMFDILSTRTSNHLGENSRVAIYKPIVPLKILPLGEKQKEKKPKADPMGSGWCRYCYGVYWSVH